VLRILLSSASLPKAYARAQTSKKTIRLDRPRTLNEFLAIAKIYIKYEEELYADSLNKTRKEEPVVESSIKPFQYKTKEGKVTREGKVPNGRFTYHQKLASNHQNPRHKRGRESTRQSTVNSTSATGTLPTIAST